MMDFLSRSERNTTPRSMQANSCRHPFRAFSLKALSRRVFQQHFCAFTCAFPPFLPSNVCVLTVYCALPRFNGYPICKCYIEGACNLNYTCSGYNFDKGDMMFRCEDKVVYGNYGVCTVTKTNEMMSLGGIERPYYVLVPLCKRGGTVYVPADHEDLMCPIMSRDEALDVLSRIESIEPDCFCDNNSRTVDEHFKHMLRTNKLAKRPFAWRKACMLASKNRPRKSACRLRCTPACLTRRSASCAASFRRHSNGPKKSLVVALEERGLKA